MEQVLWLLPAALMILSVGIRVWKAYRKGLLLALLQLGAVAASAVLAYVLTRTFLKPGTTDVMGLGAALVDRLGREELPLAGMEEFLKALPTAMLALVAFTVGFAVLKAILGGILRKLDRKYGWSKKVLCFSGNRLVAMIPGLAGAVICLLAEWMLLNGILAISSGVLTAAQLFVNEPAVEKTAVAVRELAESPAIRLTDALGCRWTFCSLTTAEKDGEEFSVGESLIGVSKLAAGVEKLGALLPGSTERPTGDDFRELANYMDRNPEAVGVIVEVLKSYREKLLPKETVEELCRAIGISGEKAENYLQKLETVTAQQDIETVCNIAAILCDRGLLPENPEVLDVSALSDPQLREEILQELRKNQKLCDFLGLNTL